MTSEPLVSRREPVHAFSQPNLSSVADHRIRFRAHVEFTSRDWRAYKKLTSLRDHSADGELPVLFTLSLTGLHTSGFLASIQNREFANPARLVGNRNLDHPRLGLLRDQLVHPAVPNQCVG